MRASEQAAERGIIIADTKFELGFIDGELALCDEVLTPDSSRFWPVDEWKPGSDAAELRQAAGARPARGDGLEQGAPAPADHRRCGRRRPAARYIEAYEIITGLKFSDWYGVS